MGVEKGSTVERTKVAYALNEPKSFSYSIRSQIRPARTNGLQ